MAFNFPASPSNGDTYTANGFTYEWDGSKWIRKSPSTGAQGGTGSTGAQGATGPTGAQGAQGHQGATGGTGATGAQGATGPTGAQGAQGHQGNTGSGGSTGAQGAEGNFGGATFYYTFESNTTNANPGSGDLRLDNSTQNAATGIYICDTDEDGTDIASYLQTIDDSTSTIKGHVKITNKLDSSQFILFTISSLTDNTGYFDITVSPVDSSATSPFSANEDILITFARTGDKGDTGAQGAAGAQGATGATGAQGATGPTGAQGAQGHQGATGGTGAQGATGNTGAQGATGSTGSQGATGSTGAQGATGSTGSQGAAGSATISTNANNRIITGGSGTNLVGESKLTFDGTSLTIEDGNEEQVLRHWTNSTDSDIYGLLSGSTFGTAHEGAHNGHHVIALRDNDANDSFAIVSGGGNYQTDTTYDKLVARFFSNGNINFGGELDITGETVCNSTLRITDTIAHVGDSDTKMRFPSNDTISFETAGSERLRIDSDGRIKIGPISDYTQNVTKSPVYIEMNSDLTTADANEGSTNTGLVRIEEISSNANRFHGIELRNRFSGDIRFLNYDVSSSNHGDFILAMPSGASSPTGLHMKLRLNSLNDSVQIAGKGGASLANTSTEHVDLYVSTKTAVTAVNTGAGGAIAGIIRFHDTGSNNNRYHGFELRNRNSGDARILNYDEGTTNKSNLVFATDSGSDIFERLRITSDGAFYIKSPNGNTGDQPGEIQWWNENGYGVMAKIGVYREGTNYAPSGLKFYTSENVDTSANNSQGDITERLFINSEGKFYKGGHQFYPLVQIYEARLSGNVSNSTTGSYQDIKTVATYTPKKVGNRVHVQVICQTWNGSTSDGTSDAYARLQHNNGGSHTTFTECDRVQGNFQYDERYHHNPFIMDGWFTTTTTNSTTIKFQGKQQGSLSVAFNWFHSYGGRVTIMEYDIT